MRGAHLIFMKFAMATILLTLTNGVYAAGNFSVMFGNKTLAESDWRPVESQTEYSLGFEFQNPGWPLALVMTYSNSQDSAAIPIFSGDVKMTGETTALNIGARKYLTKDHVRVFVEGGLTSISATIDFEFQGVSASVSDSATGYWFGAGADAMVSNALSVGVLGRMSNASVTLAGNEFEAGGTSVGIFAAYHFD